MPFAYFKRLNKAQQRIYRRSDRISSIKLPETRFDTLLEELKNNLKNDQTKEVEAVCQQFFNHLTAALNVAAVRVKVDATRPHGRWGELHGLYTPAEHRNLAQIEVWMRTAQRRQIVAFRTFLRTLLHEFCHHLDYELLKLPDSFHTEGFYQRESSLFNQIAFQNNMDA
ncbi:MAG: hypothetical protein ACHP6J_01095 [Burkholderiales bacterium]